MGPASPEGDVGVGRAGDVEAVGIVEYLGVAVARGVPQGHLLTGGNMRPSQLEVFGCGTAEVPDRRAVSQYFFHCAGHQLGMTAEQLQLVRKLLEGEQAVGDGVCGWSRCQQPRAG